MRFKRLLLGEHLVFGVWSVRDTIYELASGASYGTDIGVITASYQIYLAEMLRAWRDYDELL